MQRRDGGRNLERDDPNRNRGVVSEKEKEMVSENRVREEEYIIRRKTKRSKGNWKRRRSWLLGGTGRSRSW